MDSITSALYHQLLVEKKYKIQQSIASSSINEDSYAIVCSADLIGSIEIKRRFGSFS